jgi:hypothetical protein
MRISIHNLRRESMRASVKRVAEKWRKKRHNVDFRLPVLVFVCAVPKPKHPSRRAPFPFLPLPFLLTQKRLSHLSSFTRIPFADDLYTLHHGLCLQHDSQQDPRNAPNV